MKQGLASKTSRREAVYQRAHALNAERRGSLRLDGRIHCRQRRQRGWHGDDANPLFYMALPTGVEPVACPLGAKAGSVSEGFAKLMS